MFGRHTRLAVDAYFGIQKPYVHISSKKHYAKEVEKNGSDITYKEAASAAEKSAHRHKTHYDVKVRKATLDIGNRVLIGNIGFKGKHKLADRWDIYIYFITSSEINAYQM